MKKLTKLMYAGLLIAVCAVNTGLFAAMGGPAPAIAPEQQLYEVIQVIMEDGDVNLLKALIKKGRLDITAQYGGRHETLLTMAARTGNIEMVDYLIAQKSDVNAVNGVGETVLIAAIRHEPFSWSSNQANFEAQNKANEERWKTEVELKKLLRKEAHHLGGAATIVEDYLYGTPTATIVKRLLAAGADPRVIATVPYATPPTTITALNEAAWRNELEAVQLLIEHGADVNYATLPGAMTPLMQAYGNEKMASLLFNAGADINARDAKGRTALILASMDDEDYEDDEDDEVCSGCGEVHGRSAVSDARWLLQHGADVNIQDKYGKTALDYAKRYPKLLALLKGYRSGLFTSGEKEINEEAKAHEDWLKAHKEHAERPSPKSASAAKKEEAAQPPAESKEPKEAKERKSRHEYGEPGVESAEPETPIAAPSELSQVSEKSQSEKEQKSTFDESEQQKEAEQVPATSIGAEQAKESASGMNMLHPAYRRAINLPAAQDESIMMAVPAGALVGEEQASEEELAMDEPE